ncbi:hypothetical protein [Pontibacter rugosus]
MRQATAIGSISRGSQRHKRTPPEKIEHVISTGYVSILAASIAAAIQVWLCKPVELEALPKIGTSWKLAPARGKEQWNYGCNKYGRSYSAMAIQAIQVADSTHFRTRVENSRQPGLWDIQV